MARSYKIVRTITTEHELVIEGVLLRETREVTMESSGAHECGTVLCTRSIGERRHQIQERKLDGHYMDSKIVTNMNEEEIGEFESDWQELWVPTIQTEQYFLLL